MSFIDSTTDDQQPSPLAQLSPDDIAMATGQDEDEPDEEEELDPRIPLEHQPAANRKARLVAWSKDINLARYLDDEELDQIGMQAVTEFNIDTVSRADWFAKCEKAMRYAMQVTQAKTFPWPKASSVVFPIITQAALEFSSRAYPAFIQGKKVVKGVIWGDDKGTPATTDGKPAAADGSNVSKGPNGQPVWIVAPGEKRRRADDIAEHMSYQLLVEMPEWEPQTDQALVQAPIVGGFVRESFYDQVEKRNKSLFVPLANLVWNYHADSFDTCPRHSKVFIKYPHQIVELERAGIETEEEEGSWLHYDYAAAGGADGIQFGWDSDWQAGQGEDEHAPHVFIEQNRLIDLDDDGYAEPYTVTVHLRSNKVVRIVARFDEDGIITPKDNEELISAIKPLKPFTLYEFFPNLEGGSYPMGLGHILVTMNGAINTALNQMFDAGTLQNAGGGFIGDSLNAPSGQTLFQVGKYHRVNVKGGSIRDAVMPLTFPGPSEVLFKLLGLCIEASKALAGTSDVLSGDASIANAPPTTILALIEQGVKGYSAVMKRILRGAKSEYAKLYTLNRKHIRETQRYQVGDDFREITPDDYRLGGGVEPIADPTQATDMQKLGRAQLLMTFRGDPSMNQQEITRRVLDAGNVDRIDDLFAPPSPQQAQAMQMQMALQQAQLGELRAKELKDQTQAFLNMALARKNATAAEEGQIQAQLDFMRLNIEALNAQTRADMAHTGRVDAMMGHFQQFADRAHSHRSAALDRAHDAAEAALDRQSGTEGNAPITPTPGPQGAFPLAGTPTPGPAVNRPAPGGMPSDLGGGLQSQGPAGPSDMAALPGRATGGPLTPGQPTVVGENGPEVVTFDGNGGASVIPNQTGPGPSQRPSNPYGADPDDPQDMTNAYNTQLDPHQEAQFEAWARANPRLGNTYDYDARGFWLHGAKAAENGHGDDRWKKPNHPTFSDLSDYHGPQTPGGHWAASTAGPDGEDGWTFTPNRANPHYIGDDDLNAYWDKVEAPAGNKLALPKKDRR